MLDVATDKLTERERECLKHIRQARERVVSFAVLPLNRSEGQRVARGKARDGEEGVIATGSGW
jgi:hypothetical protein